MKLFNFFFVFMIFGAVSCTNNETQTTPEEVPADTITVSTETGVQQPEVQAQDPAVQPVQ
jgi:hypothetical protein